jgi:hypothetical protein
MLSARGYQVVHLTRHTSLELGVDVIALNSDGTPCAFQLKTARGKISLTDWRKISAQADDMVCNQLSHPSIRSKKNHESYLVTNGELEEEVFAAINRRNEQWQQTGQAHRKLQTIVRGQLLSWARELGTDLWPSELASIKEFLEFYLEDGKHPIPKDRLSSLLEDCCFVGPSVLKKKPSHRECERRIASAALLCAIGMSSFSRLENHVAEIEAWTMYLASTFACAERWNLPKTAYRKELRIGESFIYDSLLNLLQEVKRRDNLVQGIAMLDHPFKVLHVRITWVAALLSILGLWRKANGCPEGDDDVSIKQFIQSTKNKLLLWGEAAVPQLLAIRWYLRTVDATSENERIIIHLTRSICKWNQPSQKNSIPNPYYLAQEVLPHVWNLPGRRISESFSGLSYTLEGLIHLLVRCGWKQEIRGPIVNQTRIVF